MEGVNMNYEQHQNYNSSSPKDIERYAKELINLTFRDVLHKDTLLIMESGENTDYYSSKAAKGGLGHLLEKHYFHYDINSDQSADFSDAGVELKATPFKKNKNGTYSAKERLVITIIDYLKVVDENFEDSHLLAKCNLILLVYYEYVKELAKLDYPIRYVQLFHPPLNDIEIIRQDYYDIINKIKAGKAHELSEADTCYLGACTKGAKAETSLREQPFSPIPAKQRAFCFKTSYMTYVLNNYIIPGIKTYYGEEWKEEANSDVESIKFTGKFSDYIINTINKNIGKSVSELLEMYDLSYSNNRPKNLESLLIFKILGLKSNKAEEFIKANIVVKTIRFDSKDYLKETVSFPPIDFIQLAQETWEDAEINEYFSQTKFLFVAFQKDAEYEKCAKAKDFKGMDEHLHLYFSTFWNMPKADIDSYVYKCWNETKMALNQGIKVEYVGNKRTNNLPKAKDNNVCHIRPHAQNANDTAPLPTGGSFTKQSFFLNREYIQNKILAHKPN